MPDEGCLCTNGIPSRGSFKYDDRAKLIPELTTAMLSEKSAMGVYDSFIQAIDSKETKGTMPGSSMLGLWNQKKLFEIVTEYESKFEASGLRVYLCKFTSKDGVFWWFMFEDMAKVPNPVRGKTGKEGALWKEYGSTNDIGGSW